jgi:hypothetical protein
MSMTQFDGESEETPQCVQPITEPTDVQNVAATPQCPHLSKRGEAGQYGNLGVIPNFLQCKESQKPKTNDSGNFFFLPVLYDETLKKLNTYIRTIACIHQHGYIISFSS